MRAYERSGVTVDQCGDCRGIFLDRGELERLIDAEDVHYAGGQPSPSYPQRQGRGDYDDHGGHHGGRKSKRRGFLGELFD